MSIFSNYIYADNLNWWDDSFESRKNITITNTGNSTLTDFVVYLNISKELNMQTNYNDLRFTAGTCVNSSNSVFNEYEIEYYNTNQATVWIKVLNFTSGDNTFCMYYGNSSVSTGSVSTVWSDYGLVYHMESAGNDFSPNNRDKVSNIGSPIQGTDWLGYKQTYDGDDAWSLANIAYWESGWGTRTHEVVFETSSDITTRQSIFSEGGGSNGVTLYLFSGELYARWWSESTGFTGGHINTSVSTNSIYYVSMSYNFPGEYNLYVNGVKINAVATSATMNAHSGDGGIGYTGSSSKDFHDASSISGTYFEGIIHELFVYDTVNSNDSVHARNSNIINHNINTIYSPSEQRLGLITSSINTPDPLSIYFIEQDNTTIVQSTISCIGTAFSICSTVSNTLQYDSGGGVYVNIPTTSSSPAWTTSTLTQNCNLNGTDTCNLNWSLNVTDSVLSSNKFRINSSSSNTLYLSDSLSENLTIKVLGQYALSFNYTSLDFETIAKSSGDKTINVDVKADKGINNNVQVTCITGNCTQITDNFIDSITLTAPSTSSMSFTCKDDILGIFSATYRVNSTQYPTGTDISLTCEIVKVYGPINVIIHKPSTANQTTVGKNLLFKFNSTVNCIGECGEISAYLVYDSSFGDKSDGDETVTSLNTIVNSYTYLIGDEVNTDNIITVNDASNFNISDEILIWQVQNGSGLGVAGTYEYAIISGKSGNNLTIGVGLKHNYSSGNFDIVSASVTQVVRVPNYKDVIVNTGASIIAKSWDGFSGGIVTFRSNSLVTNGIINVSELGFRGGDCNGCGNNAWGDQGEGYLGKGIASELANGNGGGGGYGPSGYSGEPGAGGSLGTVGSNGTSTTTFGLLPFGGLVVGDIDFNKLFMGGGAGGGGDHDSYVGFPEFTDGAGAVLVFSKDIYNLSILANGETGITPTSDAGAPSGGGAGGSVWVSSDNLNINAISAIGGIGGVDPDDIGGDGGNGRIRLDYTTVTGNTANPIPGKIDGLTETFRIMSTDSGSLPFYSINSQPQICNPVEGGSCNFVWMVNATAEINFTSKLNVIGISNLSVIDSVYSPISAEIKIFNSIPEILIIGPLNNSKLLDKHNNFDFIFNVTDLDDGLLTCRFFLDGINLFNTSCNDGNITTISLPLSLGFHNWSVSVTDSKGGFDNTGNLVFNYYKSVHKKLTKSISRVGANQYQIDNTIENFENTSSDTIDLEFIDSKLSAGSFSLLYDFTNITFTNYIGINYGWDFILSPNSTTTLTYSITSSGFRRIKDIYIIGFE